MDESHQQLIRNLTRHVFGEDQPSTRLLNEGAFPANWITRYTALLKSVSNVWCEEELWPRDVVAAVHFASFYLQGRYEAWRYGGKRRKETEEGLGEVRGVSEVFLMGCTVAKRE